MKHLQSHLNRETKVTRSEYMAIQMANLKVGQEDLREMSDLQLTVEERLLQVVGNFYKWDALLGQNLLIKEDLFLSVDRVAENKGNNLGGRYIINVFDLSGKVSYTVCEIKDDNQIQLDSKTRILMWIGEQRPSGEVPAWSFATKQEADLVPLKSILSKVIIETKTRSLGNSVSQKDEDNADINWLQAAVIAEDDVEMLDASAISFDIDDEKSYASEVGNGYEEYMFDNNELSELEKLEISEAQIDEDLDADVREGQNKEFLQVLEYDRAFAVKGPVVKIYKNQESKQGPHQRLEYVMHLPLLKDSKGNVLEPENLLLHNSERNLMFKDRQTKQVFNFDLEKGAIVDEIQHSNELVTDNQI